MGADVHAPAEVVTALRELIQRIRPGRSPLQLSRDEPSRTTRTRIWLSKRGPGLLMAGGVILGWALATAGLSWYLGVGFAFISAGLFLLGLVGFKVVWTLMLVGIYAASSTPKDRE